MPPWLILHCFEEAHQPAGTSASAVVEQARWNKAYLDPTWRRTRFNDLPNGLLVETARLLLPGTALDMHMGEGRNALHLVALGWQVTGVDVADQALAYTQGVSVVSGAT